MEAEVVSVTVTMCRLGPKRSNSMLNYLFPLSHLTETHVFSFPHSNDAHSERACVYAE